MTCPNCGCEEIKIDRPMRGDYASETLEKTCAGCGYPRGLIQ